MTEKELLRHYARLDIRMWLYYYFIPILDGSVGENTIFERNTIKDGSGSNTSTSTI